MGCSNISSEYKGCWNTPFDVHKYIRNITIEQIRMYKSIFY